VVLHEAERMFNHKTSYISHLGQTFFFRLSRIPTVFFQEMVKKYLKFRFFIADRMKIVPNLKKNQHETN